MHWKKTVDETEKFLDGSDLPCILVETKSELLESCQIDDLQYLKEFAEEYNYDGFFRTSAKTGLNIKESMDFLINTIIQRLEDMNNNDKNNAFTPDGNCFKLDKENKEYKNKKKQHCSKY